MKELTLEEKELLLKDLCARLPYEVILLAPNGKITYETGGNTAAELLVEEGWKPYLRSMSSMTKEEEKEYLEIIGYKGEDEDGWIRCDSIHTKWGVCPDGCAKLLDYLNSIHIDYRGLIEKGLAIEINENNNPYKQ